MQKFSSFCLGAVGGIFLMGVYYQHTPDLVTVTMTLALLASAVVSDMLFR